MTSSSPIFQNWSFFLAEQHLKRKNLKKKWSKNNSPISRKCSRTLSGHYHEHIDTYLKSEIDGRPFRQEYNAWKSMVMPETGRYPVIYLAFPCIFRHSFSSTKAWRERSHRFVFENWVNSATELALAWEFLHKAQRYSPSYKKNDYSKIFYMLKDRNSIARNRQFYNLVKRVEV